MGTAKNTRLRLSPSSAEVIEMLEGFHAVIDRQFDVRDSINGFEVLAALGQTGGHFTKLFPAKEHAIAQEIMIRNFIEALTEDTTQAAGHG